MWWWFAYYPPDRHPRLSEDERRLLAPVIGAGQTADPAPPWLTLLQYRETWGLVVAKFLSDAAWYFYLFWLPKYLYDARAFDIKAVGAFAWIPYAAAGVGCLIGGWLSSYLLTRNLPLDRARKIALGLSAVVMPAVWLVPSAPVGWALAIFSLAYFGQQSWSTLVMILPADLFPRNAVGAVAGHGRLRRRDGRRRVRPGRRPPARQRLRLRRRLRHRRLAARPRLRRHLPGHSRRAPRRRAAAAPVPRPA